MDKIGEAVEELFGLHYNTNFEGMVDMMSEEYFDAAFTEELEKHINTNEVWLKTIKNLKTQEDRDNAWELYNHFLKEKLMRYGL